MGRRPVPRIGMNDQVAESDEVPRPARKRRGCRAAVVAGVALVLVAAGLVAAKVARRSHRPVAAPSVGCWAEFTTPQSDDQGHYDPPITIMVGGRLSPGDLNVRLFTAGLVAASSTPKLVTVNGVPAKLAAAKVALLNAPRDAHPYEFYAWVELGSQLDELQVAVEDESGALRVFHYVRDKAATRQRLEALAAQPAADAEAHLRLGRVLKADDAPAAIAEYRKALETDPKHPRAHLYLSEALAGTGRLGEALTHRHWTIATVESCTAGGLSYRITEVPGASAYFVGGIVAYDNRVKIEWIGVSGDLFMRHGAVSAEVAGAMSEGGRVRFDTDICLAITGIAGPGGGSPEKPVGLVYLAVADHEGVEVVRELFGADRLLTKARAAEAALALVRKRLLRKTGNLVMHENLKDREGNRAT